MMQPYSYTQIQTVLVALQQDSYAKAHFRREELCRSLAGNRVDLLIITEDCDLRIPTLPRVDEEAAAQRQKLAVLDEMDKALGYADAKAQGAAFVPRFLKKMQERFDKDEAERKRQKELLSQQVQYVIYRVRTFLTLIIVFIGRNARANFETRNFYRWKASG
jgi:hypothetical protein